MNDNKKIAQKLNKILKADNCDAMLDKTPSAVTLCIRQHLGGD